jgi:hypothetical protein
MWHWQSWPVTTLHGKYTACRILMGKITATNWVEGNIRIHSVKIDIDGKPLFPAYHTVKQSSWGKATTTILPRTNFTYILYIIPLWKTILAAVNSQIKQKNEMISKILSHKHSLLLHLLKPSLTWWFNFQLLPRTKWFYICSALVCI